MGKIKLDNSILERILDLASMMLSAGGEVKRVEETISYLCHAYGAKHADVFTITSSIVVTVRFDDEVPLTQTRRISSQRTDMKMLSELNELSRKICNTLVSSDDFKTELDKIKENKNNHFVYALFWAIVSGSFSLFFGGAWIDASFSFCVGILIYLFKAMLSSYIKNNYLLIILCSLFGGILGFLPSIIFDSVTPFYINIGNIMLLIPGIALTTSIRDMFSGDTISGLLRFAEAILVSLMIAWGFAVFGVALANESLVPVPVIQLVTALSGTLGFAVIFNCKKRNCFISSAVGFVGWGIVLLVLSIGISEYIAYFAATMVVTLIAEILARRLKSPATVFLVTGLIPLIPGKSLYSTMCYAISENWTAFFKQSLATVMYAIAIAAGIVIITAIFNSLPRKYLK